MTEQSLLSVGIDIGTSTTQVVFSRLHLVNAAAPFTVPDVKIQEKELLYAGAIHFTPLKSDTVIDTDGIRSIVAEEYKKAGIEKSQVDTGAVIITGETARKENARDVLQALSDFAGDFVVATAGPDLESVLAGAGAGADAYSKEHHCTVLHFDIGGGTTNMVLYEDGEIKSTGCLNVGGRLIKITDERIVYLSPVLDGLCRLSVGQAVTEQDLSPVISLLVQTLTDMAFGKGENIPQSLRTTPLMALPKKIDYFSFSGGVADLIYTDAPPSPFAYGDLGVLLGQAIRRSALFSHPVIVPKQTIRATVVGAGSHSTQLSGSTITFSGAKFPYRNLPVLALTAQEQDAPKQAIEKKRQWFHQSGQDTVALYLPGIKSPNFPQIQTLASEILQGMAGISPLIVAVGEDMAKALGQAILSTAPNLELVSLDGVNLSQGAYLDIGKPVANGTALPVVIKTLIFDS